MLNTSTINPLEQTTKKIINLLEQLTHNYQLILEQDNAILMRAFPPSKQRLSIFEEMDLITTDLRGYASQIKIKNQIQNPEQALENLRKIHILDDPSLADIYFIQAEQFPLIHQYLQRLDYLRFLLIDWLNNTREYRN
jgi:hypothetical protein